MNTDKPFLLDVSMLDLLNRWPQTIPVLLRYRMGCVGCSMAAFDTLADAIRIYCLPADQFIGELQAAIASRQVP